MMRVDSLKTYKMNRLTITCRSFRRHRYPTQHSKVFNSNKIFCFAWKLKITKLPRKRANQKFVFNRERPTPKLSQSGIITNVVFERFLPMIRLYESLKYIRYSL